METVYKDDNVTFRKIDNNTWLGTGNVESFESLYLIRGTEKAVLIDAGTTIPNLDKIAAQITGKPVASNQVYAVICRFSDTFTKTEGQIMLMI